MARSRRPLAKLPPFLIFLVVALVLAIVVRNKYVDYYKGLELPLGNLTLKTNVPDKPAPTIATVVAKPSMSPPAVPPPLKVPFTSQAPFALWDPLHEEACEEASLLMVYYYRTGQKFATPLEADTEIKKMVTWEESNGYKVDLRPNEKIDDYFTNPANGWKDIGIRKGDKAPRYQKGNIIAADERNMADKDIKPHWDLQVLPVSAW